MDNPVTHAFFVGRATAEAIAARIEDLLTDTLSAIGKFDAERRDDLRAFVDSVLDRAKQAESQFASTTSAVDLADLQEIIDTLRAEIAQLKAELQLYRDRG